MWANVLQCMEARGQHLLFFAIALYLVCFNFCLFFEIVFLTETRAHQLAITVLQLVQRSSILHLTSVRNTDGNLNGN